MVALECAGVTFKLHIWWPLGGGGGGGNGIYLLFISFLVHVCVVQAVCGSGGKLAEYYTLSKTLGGQVADHVSMGGGGGGGW